MTHIVIVDDEADTHLLYKLKLKKLFAPIGDLNLVSFLKAQDCLDYLHNTNSPPVDLILSDINMPEMDGFELLQEIQKLKHPVPVYVVSAYESSEYKNKARHLGAVRFLSKPVDFNQLGEALKTDLNLSF
ncbi:Transcriptional regulatory protein ZraR [compost metagenome]